jgi:5-formyltetrahydrofolate cyclo-ligase
MRFGEFNSVGDLRVGKLGILEPKESSATVYPDIMISSLSSYDKYCNRLGFGFGFYDRYTEKLRNAKNGKCYVIGAGFDC